jgi:hypothetical protein
MFTLYNVTFSTEDGNLGNYFDTFWFSDKGGLGQSRTEEECAHWIKIPSITLKGTEIPFCSFFY